MRCERIFALWRFARTKNVTAGAIRKDRKRKMKC